MLRTVNDRLKFAIKILEGAVECQLSSEAIDKLKTCEN